MNKMFKKVISATIAVGMIAASFTGCESLLGGGGEHEHTFASKWSYDTTSHWHAATCEHTEEVKDKADHVWGEGTENGDVVTYTCTCGVSKKHTHTWDEGVTEGATITYTCSGCNETKTNTVEDITPPEDGKTTYTFEAEYTYLEDFTGSGYSGGAYGTGCIIKDWGHETGASNGHYVSYLYQKGEATTLTFTINSDKAVNDAKLVLRLSGEVLETVAFTWEEWLVQVNGTNINYGSISIEGIPTDMSSEDKCPFDDFTITTTLSLKEGENVIKLITNNDRVMGGTMAATAPMVDCMKITTDAVLTWTPVENVQPYVD